MKALELLYKYQQADEIAGGYMSEPISEAIKELEALTTTTAKSKFKVGDWVVHPEAEHPWRITQNSLDHLDNTKLKLWKPKPGEWCWVFNKLRGIPVLRRVVRVEDNFKNRYDDVKFTKAVRVGREDYLDEEVGYRFCEPFLGELPSIINNKG